MENILPNVGLAILAISSAYVCFCAKPIIYSAQDTINVTINADWQKFILDERFLSFTFDTYYVTVHLRGFNLTSLKLQNVAKGLAPALFRIGGTSADTIVFENPSRGFIAMTAQDFDTMYEFAHNVGWQMSYDLNLLYRNNSQWNSTNAQLLLNYVANKGYSVDLELGNEPNLYEFTKNVDPAQIGRDYVTLRQLMNSIPAFKPRRLIGPSVTHKFTDEYAQKFLSTVNGAIDVFNIHHYYSSGTALTPEMMIDPEVLDSLSDTLNKAKDVVAKYSNGTHVVWLGETGLAYSRSAPNTTGFIAGFMWLDKIGMAATNGVSLLARQSFPSFVDKNYTPTPEYWLTLLFKRVVGQRVLQISSTEGNHYFRIYGHCTKNGEGGIVLYYLNIYTSDVPLSIPGYMGQSYEKYILTAGGNGSMSSSVVNLNGVAVGMNGNFVPLLEPVTSSVWPVVIPQRSYGFLVLPNADAIACK